MSLERTNSQSIFFFLSWGIWASIITDGQDVLIDGIAKSEVKLKEGSVVVLLGPVGGG